MNFKTRCLTINLIFIFVFILPLKANSETVLEQIDRTGLLRVGIREDAVPFGYRDVNGDLVGLCLDFINFFREELKEKLNKEVIAIKLYKSTLFNRFNLVSDKIVDIECGPNTIRQIADYNVEFSAPFFLTGTQFLIKGDNQTKFDPNSSLENVNIGLLRNTTNQTLIMQNYPLANIVEFQGVTGRYRGIQSLQGDKIQAFASDGILLVGEAILQGLDLGQDYILVPKFPLDCENYGLILPNNDPEWLAFVNAVIKNNKSKESFYKWFGVVLPRIEEIESFCRSQGQS
ncbi:amino acid ABC transporter substrate-binding protein [Aphanothece sacrum]|uniref:ABC transporter substrate-binding protein n=1 Tax=Aphanothece sacrum FPU1 TaxID=1920663 RepID=A0A401IMU8_APHSA|nr:amino acid ABC transporter substrate-binding protein [Aphanothece sacrum]GBF82565.1 ABC transporter substrate-binding protein [Aphanothece sacrum FPU1]GBF84699.1 ABC transporter substrate-binding protein [Aphanothece sacrum FPU3]